MALSADEFLGIKSKKEVTLSADKFLGIKPSANDFLGIKETGNMPQVAPTPQISPEGLASAPEAEKVGLSWTPPKPAEVLTTPPKRTFFQKLKRIPMSIVERSPVAQKAHSQNIYAIASKINKGKTTQEVIDFVSKNYEKLIADPKITGLHREPTTPELMGAMMIFPIAAGLASHPLSVVAGIGGFMALDEIENAIVNKIKGEDYQFLASKGLKELLPEEASQLSRDVADIFDFVGKGAIMGGIKAKTRPLFDKFTKNIIEEYKLPKKVFISPKKVRSIFQTGKEISPEEMQLVKDLHLSKAQWRQAVAKGVDIEIPSTRIITNTDKPWWAKIKEWDNRGISEPTIMVKRTSEVIGEPGKALGLPPGKGIVTQPIAKPPTAPPQAPISPTGALKPVEPSVTPKAGVEGVKPPAVKPEVAEPTTAEVDVIEKFVSKRKQYGEESQRKWAIKVVDAIKNKDVVYLQQVMNGINPDTNKLFTEITGLQSKTQIETDKSLEQLNPQKWKEYIEQKQQQKEQRLIERKKEVKDKKISEVLNKKIKHEGEVMTNKDFIDRLISEGYTKLISRKRGKFFTYNLSRPDGQGYAFKRKIEADYINEKIAPKPPKPPVKAVAPDIGSQARQSVKEGKTVEEFVYSQPTLESVKRANPELFRKAQKATNVDEFLQKMGTPDKVDYPTLVGFYNKIRGLVSESQLTAAYDKAKGEVKPPVVEKELPVKKEVEKIQEESIPTEPAEKYLDKDIIPAIKKVESVFDGIEGTAKIPAVKNLFEPIKNLYDKTHDWIFTFGEARRAHPELYDRLMKSFAERNAGIEKAITDIEGVLEGKTISPEDDVELALTYEDKRLSIRPELKERYDKFSALLKNVETASLRKGIFRQSFQDRMIDDNLIKIEQLRQERVFPERSKKIQDLLDENEKIKNMRYLPHRSVVARVVEAKIQALTGEDKRIFIEKASRISAKFKMRTGRKFLEEYLRSGLLKPEDIGMRKLAVETLNSYYYRSSLQDLYDYAKRTELIKPVSEKLLLEGWYKARDIGITAPELRNQLVHPLLADSLSEMKEMGAGKRGNIVRQTMGLVKVAQFIKPSIIWIYDTVQKVMRGAYSLNPITEIKELTRASRDVWNKSPRYHELNKLNLFSFPYETPKAAVDEQIKMMIRRTQSDIPNLIKKLESITDMSWAKGDISPQDLLMAAYRGMANATWTGDKIIRTQSVGILERMGYSTEEAVKIASRAHGAYSELSLKFKKTLSPIVFVHSFRVLMPIEMAKIVGEPIKGLLDWKAKENGKKPRKSDVERWAKAILATIVMPVAIDQYLKARGFERDKWGWKWRKKIKGRKEIVVGVNFILNMPVKWWHRLTTYNPIDPTYRGIQGIRNFIKWEIHPITRIFFWDIAKNQKSFGSGEYVYDPNETNIAKQSAQIIKYVFGQSFRLYGKMMDATDAGNITTKEQMENEQIMKENLSKLDRTLFLIFGYAYIRKGQLERKRRMNKWLKLEFGKRKNSIIKKYPKKVTYQKIKKLRKWNIACRQWIRTKMR